MGVQAIVNVLLSKVHIKKKAGFKATEKTGAGMAAPPLAQTTNQIQSFMLSRVNSLTRRFNQVCGVQVLACVLVWVGA